jgi:flavin-dependent dehydrogenase
MSFDTDIIVIGAGPAGAAAAALLVDRGRAVEVVERTHFPRFSIGESLLPQSMAILQEAGLLGAVDAAGFQFKDGAAFQRGGEYTSIYFPDMSATGPATTFQVARAEFDQILADGAAAKGARITYGEEVTAFESDAHGARVTCRDEKGAVRTIRARFCLDASGFGRVLSRLLGIEAPSVFPPRRAYFCHVRDNITDPGFDRNKILISIHPEDDQIWYWLIPLADGLSSIGVVGPVSTLEAAGADDHARLWALVAQSGRMADLLARSEQVRPSATIAGYACSVTSLVGPSYALLGNAGEFLDPVFSSGVTIALKSASLAAGLVDRALDGEEVDWKTDFEAELYRGINTFKTCVGAWYDVSLQRIIMNKPGVANRVTSHLISVLAGYAWDKDNPLVQQPRRYLDAMDQLCAA